MKKPYFLHKELPHIVKEYIENHQIIDLDLLTQHIIENNFQFRNMKFKPFRNSVNTALQWNTYLLEKEKKSFKNSGSADEKKSSDIRNYREEANNSDIQILEKNNGILQKSRSRTKKESQIESDIQNAVLNKFKENAFPSFPKKGCQLHELGGITSLLDPLYMISRRVLSMFRPAVSMLVTGPEQCGKSTLVRALAETMKMSIYELDLEEIFGCALSSPSKRVQEELSKANASLPGVILVHKLELLFVRDGLTSLRQCEQFAAVTTLRNYIEGLTGSSDCQSVLVVGETSQPEMLLLKLKQVFRYTVRIAPPSVADKTEMLQHLCAPDTDDSSSLDLSAVALKASGFVAGDLVCLVDQARMLAECREAKADMCGMTSMVELTEWCYRGDYEFTDTEMSTEDLLNSVKMVTPTLKQHGFPAIPDTTWEDIGGLESVKKSLRDCILRPIKYPEYGVRYGMKQNSGILLWGPPGCGKTLLAKAVANEAGINLLIVNGPELLSMYQGESERSVRMVFARAASVAPCVIFFDEFDSLCPRRSKGGSDSGSKSTIVNMLLSEMDGFLSRPGIYLIAATNLPSVLDPAVLRPGRFDNKLYVGPPDEQGRAAVLRAATKNGTLPRLASEVDLVSIASRSECLHYSGADCRNLVDVAIKEAIEEHELGHHRDDEQHRVCGKKRTREENKNEREMELENISAKKVKSDDICDVAERKEKTVPVASSNGAHPNCRSEEYALYNRHFLAALKKVKPSVTEKERAKYDQQLLEFQQEILPGVN